jgi:hypothetical protein
MKNNSKYFLYILFAFSVLVSCSSNTEKAGINSREKSLHLKCSIPERTIIQIYNSAKTDINYSIRLNNLIFYDFKGILDTIKKSKSDKPDFYRAWQFVNKNTEHVTFFSKENWLYSPVILINSAGFANCGMRAAALCNIWLKLGYTARVWHLEGHVVPEIFINKRWEMYDPDMNVYYLNKDNQVAGVEELMKNPSYIIKPADRFKSSDITYEDTSRYSKTTAGLYSTVANNFLFNWKVEESDLDQQLEFTLPPKSVFIFPARYEKELLSTRKDEIKNYSNAKLTFPPGWSGIIDIPLIVHNIKGVGIVSINNKNYNIGSPELKSLIDRRETFIHTLKFISAKSTVQIIYLVNKKVFKLDTFNTLVLKGQDIDKLQVNLYHYE